MTIPNTRSLDPGSYQRSLFVKRCQFQCCDDCCRYDPHVYFWVNYQIGMPWWFQTPRVAKKIGQVRLYDSFDLPKQSGEKNPFARELYENPLSIHGFSTVSEAPRKNTVLGQSLVVPYTLSPFELIVGF